MASRSTDVSPAGVPLSAGDDPVPPSGTSEVGPKCEPADAGVAPFRRTLRGSSEAADCPGAISSGTACPVKPRPAMD
jgi:hypothetical protein